MTETANLQNRTRIGSSGLEVTPVVLGGNVFGWTADRDATFSVLDAFTSGGGDMIDSADSYSSWAAGNRGGESETLVGEWLVARGARDRVTVATKVSQHPEFRGLAGDNVRAAADASLARLGTTHIDLYWAHYDDADTPLEDTVAAFSELVDAGKIRTIGVSNYTAARVGEWIEIARAGGYHLPVALQPHYNLLERGYESNGLWEVADAEGLAVFPYYSLAEGFLTGKYRDPADVAATGASPRAEGAARFLDDRGRAVLAVLDEVAAAHGVGVASVALAWLRQQPTITGPIASARTAAQVEPLLTSLTLTLAPAELEALSAASD